MLESLRVSLLVEGTALESRGEANLTVESVAALGLLRSRRLRERSSGPPWAQGTQAHRGLGTIGTTALLLVGSMPGSVACQSPELELFEQDSWTAPADFRVSGAVYSPSGEILVWSRDPARVITLNSDLEILNDLRPPSTLEIVAVGRGSSGTTELLSRGPLGISRTVRGDDWSFQALDLEGIPSVAVRNESGWYVRLTMTSPTDRAWTVFVPLEGPPEPILDNDMGRAAANLTATDSTVVVTLTESPHRWTVVDGANVGLTGQPPSALLDSLSAAIDRGVQRQWHAVGTVPLDNGYVQSIADLTSNWRVLVLYDGGGRPIRNPIFRLPMGIFGSDIESKSLYAVVRLNQTEVIRYEWRWRRAGG